MPRWVYLCLLLPLFGWALWYFSRAFWVGLTQGRVIDSDPYDGIPVTRERKPFGYWLFMSIAAAMVAGSLYLIVLLAGELAGFWEVGA